MQTKRGPAHATNFGPHVPRKCAANYVRFEMNTRIGLGADAALVHSLRSTAVNEAFCPVQPVEGERQTDDLIRSWAISAHKNK